jgi:hypothetical protein
LKKNYKKRIQSKKKYKSKQQEPNLKHRQKNKFIFLQNNMNPDERREKKKNWKKRKRGCYAPSTVTLATLT